MDKYCILLYSKYSQVCMNLLATVKDSPINLTTSIGLVSLCIDNKNVRERMYNTIKIPPDTKVPCILIVYRDNKYDIIQDAISWIDTSVKKLLPILQPPDLVQEQVVTTSGGNPQYVPRVSNIDQVDTGTDDNDDNDDNDDDISITSGMRNDDTRTRHPSQDIQEAYSRNNTRKINRVNNDSRDTVLSADQIRQERDRMNNTKPLPVQNNKSNNNKNNIRNNTKNNNSGNTKNSKSGKSTKSNKKNTSSIQDLEELEELSDNEDAQPEQFDSEQEQTAESESDEAEEIPKPKAALRNGPANYDMDTEFVETKSNSKKKASNNNKNIKGNIKGNTKSRKTASSSADNAVRSISTSNLMATAMAMQKERDHIEPPRNKRYG